MTDHEITNNKMMPTIQDMTLNENPYLKPSKKIIGIADGKYKMPPDELFFDDEINKSFDN